MTYKKFSFLSAASGDAGIEQRMSVRASLRLSDRLSGFFYYHSVEAQHRAHFPSLKSTISYFFHCFLKSTGAQTDL